LPLPAWRAFFEMVMLIPAGLAGIVSFYIAAWTMGVRDDQWANLASTIGMGVAAGLAVAFFVWLDRQSAASIGWTGRAFFRQIAVGILWLCCTYALLITLVIIVMILFPALQDEAPTAQRAVREVMPDMPLRSMIAMMLFVAIWEEAVFRGFVLTRLHAIVRRWWLAVPISAMIFGSVHLYEGPLAMVVVTLLGVVLALVFIRRRSLTAGIVMHFLHNSFMLVMMHQRWLDP
jgi:membrane protease YdiL (CAAX protease family)